MYRIELRPADGVCKCGCGKPTFVAWLVRPDGSSNPLGGVWGRAYYCEVCYSEEKL